MTGDGQHCKQRVSSSEHQRYFDLEVEKIIKRDESRS